MLHVPETRVPRARFPVIDFHTHLGFSAAGIVRYEWTEDGWARFDGDNPHMTEAGEQIVVDNVTFLGGSEFLF